MKKPKRRETTIVGPYGVAMLEIMNDVIWDTVKVPKDRLTATLFRQVWTDDFSGISTNMVKDSELPNPQSFKVERIWCAFFHSDGLLPVSHPIYWHSKIEFKVGDLCKIYWNSPAWVIAHPCAVFNGPPYHVPSEFTQAVKKYFNNGRFNEELVLRFGIYFYATLYLSKVFPDPNLAFTILLEGQRARSLA